MEGKEAGSLMTVVRETVKYKLHLEGVQARWDRGGTKPASDHKFFHGKGNESHELGTGLFIHKKII
jgi:hypothetical protein